MIAPIKQTVKPKMVRIDASTVCQLKCPSCPTASGATGKKLGTGFLKLEDFKKFVRENPYVSHIELSNWGEVFLNKELGRILEHAYKKNIFMYIANGANLNTVREDDLEALVKYKVQKMTCSIDGASQETYEKYRVKGNFDNVISHIRKINYWKAVYRSAYPQLIWQFVAFGHNEHEIAEARRMAQELDMTFYLKLSWDDLYGLPYQSPVKDKELIRKESGTGASSRNEHIEKFGQVYVERTCCSELWTAPQLNYDGKVLGCPINYWGDFGNAFQDGLENCLNGEKINLAKDMLMGKREANEEIPCASCRVYKNLKKHGAWITEDITQTQYLPSRKFIMLENKMLGRNKTVWLSEFLYYLKNFPGKFKTAVENKRLHLNVISSGMPKIQPEIKLLPNKGYPLSIPMPMDADAKWKPYFIFRGTTKGLSDFSCHASVLVNGHCPHPPETHKEEEILMMLKGEAKLELPQHQEGDVYLKAGQFVYYPSGFQHTLQTVSSEPANYLMFKWHAPKSEKHNSTLPFGKYEIGKYFQDKHVGLNTNLIFEKPTQCLTRFQAHASVLTPGASYKPHADLYDVAIVVIEGEVKTLGKIFGPNSVIFYPAGKLHGMANHNSIPAKYIVFEFER